MSRARVLCRSLAALVACGLLVWGSSAGEAPREIDRRGPTSAAASRVTDSRGGHGLERDRSSEVHVASLPDAPTGIDAQQPERSPNAVPPLPGRRLLLGGAGDARPGDPSAVAHAVLDEHRDALGLTRMPGELRVEREFASLTGWHLRLVQVLDGVPVHRSHVGVHLDQRNRPLLLAADVHPLEGVATRPSVSARAALAAVTELLTEDEDEIEDAVVPYGPARLLILPEGRTGRLVWQVDVASGRESLRVFVDALDGEPSGYEPLQCAATGKGRVFDPNPVFTRRDTSLQDKNDINQPVLDAQMVGVDLLRLDGTGFLRGTWADVTPTKDATRSTALVFTGAARDDPRFEQVMCYYHVDRLQQYLQDLGITNANAESQKVDARAAPEDQSIYDVARDRLEFGTGGVDDAEDADIIRHEYGHALHFDQVGGFGLSNETGALGEGFGDFLAAVFHESGNANFDAAVGSWDATSYSQTNPPALRRVDGQKRYPQDIVGRVHEDGEIWSGFLWDLRDLLGRDDTVRLVVESHFFYGTSARFQDAANGLLSANIALRAAADDGALRELLQSRGLPFTKPPPPPPDEDAFEPNDTLQTATPIEPGFHSSLLLADPDWYRILVPAGRRVHVLASFDNARVDLNLEVRTETGAVLSYSRSLESTESVELVGGAQDAVQLLRVHQGGGVATVGGYTLSINITDLDMLAPGETVVLDMTPGRLFAFHVPVPAEKIDGRAQLRVLSKRSGRKGAVNELRLIDPSGAEIHAFGEGATRKGAKHVLVPDLPGFWRVEVRGVDGASGPFKLKAVLRKRKRR